MEVTMPVECRLLEREPFAVEKCPKCGTLAPEFMRGQVQRSKRFLWVLWRRPYCAVICHGCKEIIGWESPPNAPKTLRPVAVARQPRAGLVEE
jgi:hypothetical protein